MSNLPSPLTVKALSYTWQQLAWRAGVSYIGQQGTGFENAGISVRYGQPDNITLSDEPAVVVCPSADHTWRTLLEKPFDSLDWLSVDTVLPNRMPYLRDESIPVLFWGQRYEDGRKPFAELYNENTVVFYADIVATVFFMLSRWEETVVPDRDEHGRFPATASVAYKKNLLDRPIVDEYALILQAWLRMLLPRWKPATPRFSIRLSHDIDCVCSGTVRKLGGDLLKRRSLSKATQTLRSIIAPENDPPVRGIYDLAKLSEQHNLESAFFFMAAEPGPYDNGYNPESSIVRQCIADLRERGHEVGFHPSYRTIEEPDRFMAEKRRLDAVLETTHYGGRQHYLRFRVPDTWRLWEQASLSYDSTLSYADHEGFRCGTCHPFHPFDMEQDRQLDLLEIPLIVMDGTLKQYRGLTPDEGEKRILELAQRCRHVGGTFTLLWHNSSLPGEWEPWAKMYRRVVAHLAKWIR